MIGVGTSVFAVVNATMLRPLPFPDQDRLVRVFTMPPGVTESRSRNPLASVDFVRFLEGARSLDRLEVIWQRERSLAGTAGDPAIVKAGDVSAGFFDLLGGRTALYIDTISAILRVLRTGRSDSASTNLRTRALPGATTDTRSATRSVSR